MDDCVNKEATYIEAIMHKTELVEVDEIRKLYVDERYGALDREFVKTLFKKCAFIVAPREWYGALHKEGGTFCQAGFVENHDGLARMVTTKHSFGDRELKGYLCSVSRLQISTPDCPFYTERNPSVFPESKEKSEQVHLRDGEYWRHGIDMTWGPEFESFFEAMGPISLKRFDGLGSFKMVRRDFDIQKGQLVGMIVNNRYGVEVDESSPPCVLNSDLKEDEDLTKEMVNKLFGPKDSVVILTGKITFVAPKHIEHNMNTAKAFAGAILFLLDVEGQPDSVKAEDRGKAIA
ncbi:MAG: hypothetical protein SGARI_002426, partial [Bacillariaceae sp.]